MCPAVYLNIRCFFLSLFLYSILSSAASVGAFVSIFSIYNYFLFVFFFSISFYLKTVITSVQGLLLAVLSDFSITLYALSLKWLLSKCVPIKHITSISLVLLVLIVHSCYISGKKNCFLKIIKWYVSIDIVLCDILLMLCTVKFTISSMFFVQICVFQNVCLLVCTDTHVSL